MTKLWSALLALGLLGGLLTPLVPVGTAAAGSAAPYFADSAFAQVWTRTDSLVASAQATRSWIWGPQQDSGPIYEPYKGLPGDKHLVQYFDKSRMEVNDPGGDRNSQWFVTNGLLTVELISGVMRVGLGQNDVQELGPAQIPLASDTDDPNAPTYASFRKVSSTPGNDHPATAQVGAAVDAVINRSGNVSHDAGRILPETQIARFVPETQHNIPGVFWTFLNASGLVAQNGGTTTAPIWNPWYFATGYPISEAYWADVKIAGQMHWVLIQAYQRRVLTYIPDYDPPWNVAMGNIGQHYVQWRYPNGLPGQAVIYNPASRGVICRAHAAPGAPCDPADPTGPPPSAAYYDDTIRAAADGTLNAQTPAAKFRLLPGAAVQFPNNANLNAAQRFLIQSGEALFDHKNANGEIEISGGDVSIRPLDTVFSVGHDANGDLKISVLEGDRGVRVISRRQQDTVTAGTQLRVDANGTLDQIEGFDGETNRIWAVYGPGGNLDGDVPQLNLNSCSTPSTLYPQQGNTRLGCAMQDATVYNDAVPGLVAQFENGEVLFDEQSGTPTEYVIYGSPITSGKATWESYFSPGADLPQFQKDHPAAVARLGQNLTTCPNAAWATQMFAGGTVVELPDMETCSASTPAPVGLVLYLDGTTEPFFVNPLALFAGLRGPAVSGAARP